MLTVVYTVEDEEIKLHALKNYVRKGKGKGKGKVKGKVVPLQAESGPEGSRKLRFPHFMTTAQEKLCRDCLTMKRSRWTRLGYVTV